MKENDRSRLVVGENRCKEAIGRALSATFLFSVMPTLEGIKMLGSLMVTMLRSKRDKPSASAILVHLTKLISTERHNVKSTWICQREEQDGERCGLLVKSMYGAQDASALWQDDNMQVLENAMHMRRAASGTVPLVSLRTVETWSWR